ncbi:YgfZ/GcvT domain-containing protein [Tranquillimonas rosea]|uniref:CAF17-like 4Fe-4S cluster assembly/insertion protein YgfZ n=1 Tax=Tranquillimonas rosea TaxID=641238 RepID=UPI003BAA0AE4
MTTERRMLAVGGQDRSEFLQGLITNDVLHLKDGLVYAALLTAQGKYLADFFLLDRGDDILLDAPAAVWDALVKKLKMYKLRSKVTLDEVDVSLARGLGEAPEGALRDPRHPAMGWRAYGTDLTDEDVDWDALRVANCIPEAGVELVPDESFILECGFTRLNGVDFRKGCYVGQEVTARMHHKTELKKGLATVSVEGEAPVGTPITSEGKPAGTLYTQADGQGIAYLRLNRAQGAMEAGEARLMLAA